VDDPAAVIAADVRRLHRRMRILGATRTFAVFMADDGVRWSDVERPRYPSMVERFGHRLVGYYNARVDREALLVDVLHEARAAGIL